VLSAGLLIAIHIQLRLLIRVHSCPFAVSFVPFAPDDDAKVRELFGELIRQKVDETFKLIPPFYTEGGLNIRVGHKVFINQCCTIYDMGGVDIGDLVMIGPKVNIITAGHPVEPAKRRAYIEAKPIVIEKNVWIATAVTILGGVTVDENSVIGAGAVVTKDVPANSFVCRCAR
jgi:acetyltransferase-like isoleucine patch superfamily enzyme